MPSTAELLRRIGTLERTVADLQDKMKRHSHTGTDGSGVLDRARINSVIFIPQGNNRIPRFDGEWFYHNSGGVQNFRTKMGEYEYTVDLSFL